MDLEALYTARFQRLDSAVEDLKSGLNAISSSGKLQLQTVVENLAPREAAELNMTVAAAIVSLYRAHLRCQGTDDSKHVIGQECERIDTYVAKLSSSSKSSARPVPMQG